MGSNGLREVYEVKAKVWDSNSFILNQWLRETPSFVKKPATEGETSNENFQEKFFVL